MYVCMYVCVCVCVCVRKNNLYIDIFITKKEKMGKKRDLRLLY